MSESEAQLQARKFNEDGYLVVPNLVSQEDLDAIDDELLRFARGEYPTVNSPSEQTGTSASDPRENILAIHHPHWVSDVILETISHPGITDVLQRITAAHLPHWDGSVKCMQSMLFAKPPGYQGQAWHQDERYIPTRDRSLIGAWMALDDATAANGCLRVIPGSHRTGYLWPTRDHDKPEEFDFSDESHGFDEGEELLVEVKSGTVVFFNGYLLHRSLRNSSDGFRRALVNHYCNAWSLLPWTTSVSEKVHVFQIGMLDHRNVVPIGSDPYASKGYSDRPTRVFLRPRGS